MNNIESQIGSLANEEEPYVGMPLIGLNRDMDHRRCMPDHREHGRCTPDPCDHDQGHCMPEHGHCMPDHHDHMPLPGDPLAGLPIAMAYVPWQCWRDIYEPAEALCRGTIFAELDLPFLGGEC